MLFGSKIARWAGSLCALLLAAVPALSQNNVTVRVMAANLPGDSQSYGASQIRILQGLKPDVVAIQEFNHAGTTRTFVDTAFGTNFSFFRESGYSLPNGVISRWPILSAGSWLDTVQTSPNRGFAWAQIDLPGTNDLYVVSVHLLTSSSANRANEAANLKALIQSNFPVNAWVVLAGDFNTDSRDEVALTTLTNFLSDHPVPTDAESNGSPNTNLGRNKPYDYVLTSFPLANRITNVVFATRSFPNGLVFDSRVYTPLSDVAPVLSSDSAAGQHMAVVKDFVIFDDVSATNPPSILTQPQPQVVPMGSNVTFTVEASGTAPLRYQWRFNETNLAGATASSYTRTNALVAHAGEYSVVITNLFGNATSSPALLTVDSQPFIFTQPQNVTVPAGGSALFEVIATGAAPLGYQWRFGEFGLAGATTTQLTLTNTQSIHVGDYRVVVTNSFGSVTSTIATLTLDTPPSGTPTTLAGWDVSTLAMFGPSPLPPITNSPQVTVVGLTRGAGIGTGGSAAARAWGGNGFDAVSANAAITAGDFATFSIAAQPGYKVSFTAIRQFDYRRSGTGPPSGVLQFQVGNGTFVSITNLAYSSSAGSGAALPAIDLAGISALRNVAAGTAVTFRTVNYGGGSGGTWYIYDVANTAAADLAVEGIVSSITAPTNPPPTAAVLSSPHLEAGGLSFNVAGSAGTNYVIQASTNLAATNWIPAHTNTAPFSFTDSNLNQFPQRYYRAVSQP
jgi:endonuclease/exonuclease/phosphatase family metal-dependent hydrolase